MNLKVQPKPEVSSFPADQGIVSRKQFFAKKTFDEIKQYFFPALLIRPWKSKADLLFPAQVADTSTIQYECYYNRNIQNCFVEDFAEEIFLRTPPTCFVVFGKPGACVKELGKQIAEAFGSVLLNVDDIVDRVLRTETQTGRLLDRILRLGLHLTLNFILALLSYMAHTAEARHRGYVICGLPSLALLQDMPVEQQFSYLFTWDNKPTIFIHVLFQDEDLIKERTSMRYEVRRSGRESSLLGYLEQRDFPEEEESENLQVGAPPIAEEIVLEPDINISPSRPSVQLPKDEESRVWTELELFDAMIKPVIDLIKARVDPQCFLIVDSRVDNRFEFVMAQLELLHVWKAPEAAPFIPPDLERTDTERESEETESEGEGSEKESLDEDILRVAEESPQVAFLTLFAKKTISPKFRWELSHYNYICPVSLREGEVVEGKSRFAVTFMKYIFFLRDRDCVTKFLKNPRAYVLPVRPKPLCRFFILGYPFTGKTTMARTMSTEFAIPLIDAQEVLKNDAERKKNSYKEFCKQKAECREIIRLTVLAWKDWRMEEEKRINLIEEWIVYLQHLLQKRIDQFYSAGVTGDVSDKSVSQRVGSGNLTSSDRTSGLSILARKPKIRRKDFLAPPPHIVEAVKEGRSDYNRNEANSYLSSVWRSFSGRPRRYSGESASEEGYFGEDFFEESEESDDECQGAVNWCDLLPPQSLSTFLITTLPYTTRVKRKNFKIFLEAASKAYHEPSVLKSEFAKWHLPCFMDIPLCGILLENPTFLLRYVPVWLRERPLIPDPVDPMHPSVLAEGQKAFRKADMVVVRQNAEEQGILIRNAIEKAEREGMRVTGEVITPGGWVVDNMILDVAVWKKLLCDKVFADHVYILVDSEPNHRRIITTWWDMYGKEACSRTSLKPSEAEGEHEELGEQSEASSLSVYSPVSQQSISKSSVISLLEEWVAATSKGDKQLDDIYERLKPDISSIKYFVPPFSVDPFCHSLFQNTIENWNVLRDDTQQEEDTSVIQTLTGLVSRSLFWNRELTASFTKIPLGTELERCTEAVMDLFKKKPVKTDTLEEIKMVVTGCVEFFKYLHTLPGKLDQLKQLFEEAGRGESIEEIDINGRTPEMVFNEIRDKLMSPFIKKPRELEDFEIEEIRASTEEKEHRWTDDEDESEVGEKEQTEAEAEGEDVRIFGESGQLCIVSLERNKYLIGRPEYSLRYYGKLYYFWNQDCKNKFLENPEKYAPYYSAIRCYPPLRIYVVGPIGSGRSILTTAIARQCCVTPLDFSIFLKKKLLPHSHSSAKKFEPIDKRSVLLMENHNEPALRLKEQFMRVPYGKRNFWLQHSFHTSYEDNKEMYDLLQKISINPVSFEDYPELKYSCVESVYDTFGDDYMEMQPRITDYSDVPYMSMKEVAAALENPLTALHDLRDYERTLNSLWNEEPYISHGFVLRGFPRNIQDVKFIVKQNWIPDLVVEMVLPEHAIIERNVDRLMERWELKLKQEMADQEALELALTTIQSICRELKQRELYLEQRKQSSLAENLTWRREGSVESDTSERDRRSSSKVMSRKRRVTQEVHWSTDELMIASKIPESVKKEIEISLDNEFPPLVFKPVFETFDSAKVRVIEDLIKNFRREVSELEEIKPILTELNIPWYEIDGMKDQKVCERELFLKLDKVRGNQPLKGEFAFAVTMDMADKLLRQGYYFLSKFGRLCPVQARRMKNPIHMFRPLRARQKIFPIAYRNYIYFVAGESEKTKFLQDPLKYIFTEDHRPSLPLRIAIIGPPKSGKSTLSKRLGATFGLKVVTMGSALRFALEKTPDSTLAKLINSYLRRGCFLPLSLKLEALMLYLIDPSCGTQGYVFDGIPFDAALMQSLAERGKLPFVVISLVADSHFGKVNREELNLKEFRLPYKNRINLDTRYKDWMETYKRFANWNVNTYNNVYEVDAKLNTVDIFYKVYDIIKESFFEILKYFKFCVHSKPLSLKHLCIGLQEYQSKRGMFGNNCPVCWVEANRLRSSEDARPKCGLVEYKSRFYWICPEHIKKFMTNARKYMPPYSPVWPETFPERLTVNVEMRDSLMLKVHGHGRCPVTRIDFPSSLEWEGSWDFAASYADEIFLCKNEKMLQRFLAQPWRYHQANTIFEWKRVGKSNAVVNLGPPKLTSLPPIGFLEQTVADLLHESLQNVGSFRPLYPNMHPRVTGCVFVALFLKVYNKTRKPCSLDIKCFDFFIKNCKSTRYKVNIIRPPYSGLGQGDFEPDISDDSDSSGMEVSRRSTDLFERNWLDFETQAAKRMWSAKNQSEKYVEMKLTEKDELVEIPEVPATVAILRLENASLRPSPIPPVEDCLNFIFSISSRMHLPDEFNYNSLHQSPLPFSSPFTPQILFNPQKQFSQSLFERKDPGFPSAINLHHEKRVLSDCSVPETKAKPPLEQNEELMKKGFFPRFPVLDKFRPANTPLPPKVVEKEPIILNPNFDHSYMMLMSEFFHTTHYLRCYHFNEGHRNVDFMDRHDRNLEFDNQFDYLSVPRRTTSMRSRTSVDSYQQVFDSVTPFLVPDSYVKPAEDFVAEGRSKMPSLTTYLEAALAEKYERNFLAASSAISYESFEINVVPTNSDVSHWSEVQVHERLAFPPLPWDIITRPYYALCAVPSIFDKPHLDYIAHERHVSLLDGITEFNEEYRFVHYPGYIQIKLNEGSAQAKRRKSQPPGSDVHFYFDFFNIPWTSFMSYQYKWMFNTDGLNEKGEAVEEHWPAGQRPLF